MNTDGNPTAQVIVAISDDEADHIVSDLTDNGYYRQDGYGLSILGTFIGYVLCRFDPGNVAGDFIIVSVVPNE